MPLFFGSLQLRQSLRVPFQSAVFKLPLTKKHLAQGSEPWNRIGTPKWWCISISSAVPLAQEKVWLPVSLWGPKFGRICSWKVYQVGINHAYVDPNLSITPYRLARREHLRQDLIGEHLHSWNSRAGVLAIPVVLAIQVHTVYRKTKGLSLMCYHCCMHVCRTEYHHRCF